MMGTKERRFDPLPREISLEDLVPEDSFYRRLESRLDLSFVRDLVRPFYAGGVWYKRTADFLASRTDPDSSPMKRRDSKGSHLGYYAH
jgi:hypothetical protein